MNETKKEVFTASQKRRPSSVYRPVDGVIERRQFSPGRDASVKCLNSFQGVFSCGKCTPCLVNVRRKWITKMMMEQREHTGSCFLTLTYSEANVPSISTGELTLRREHLTAFLKRLRGRLAPLPLRFFAIGEYGESTVRPHYHAILFGMPSCVVKLKGSLNCPCHVCSMYSKVWNMGGVWAGTSTVESIKYVANYVTKGKYGLANSGVIGVQLPFSMQSVRPPLGSKMEHEIASSMLRYHNQPIDVPGEITFNGRLWPISNAARRRIRKLMGRDPSTPMWKNTERYHATIAKGEELLQLSSDAFAARKKQEANDREGYANSVDWKEKQRKEKL